MTTAYPIAWPQGWPRTPVHQLQDSKYRFGRNGSGGRSLWTFATARDALGDELNRLGARQIVLSTVYELRLDGQPHAARGRPQDQGVAIYFLLRGKAMVMACDMHLRAEENMRSLALSIEAMRTLERHGGGVMMEKAFTGFAALPPPGPVILASGPSWRAVLEFTDHFWEGLDRPTARNVVGDRYRQLAKASGGGAALLALNLARDAALKEIGT